MVWEWIKVAYPNTTTKSILSKDQVNFKLLGGMDLIDTENILKVKGLDTDQPARIA